MNTPPTGWEGILDDNEAILWQGRPDGAVVWSDLLSFESLFGVFFAGFSVFWIAGAAIATGGHGGSGGGIDGVFAFFPLFGLPFLAVGLYLVIGRLFWDAYQRSQTWFTLTDRAAYIARQTLGRRSLKRYAIADMHEPELQDDTPGSVIFTQETRTYRSNTRNGRGRTRTQHVPIGFRRIDDARAVYRLIVEHRKASAKAETARA